MSDLNSTPDGKVVPDPEYVIRGNKVKCTYCGLKLKTRMAYVSHFMRRHMNEDGTWRPAEHRFDPLIELNLTPAEQAAVDEEMGRSKKPKYDIFGIQRKYE